MVDQLATSKQERQKQAENISALQTKVSFYQILYCLHKACPHHVKQILSNSEFFNRCSRVATSCNAGIESRTQFVNVFDQVSQLEGEVSKLQEQIAGIQHPLSPGTLTRASEAYCVAKLICGILQFSVRFRPCG